MGCVSKSRMEDGGMIQIFRHTERQKNNGHGHRATVGKHSQTVNKYANQPGDKY